MDGMIENVGRQLRMLRRARGLTLAELADRAGCTDGYLSNIEKGATVPSLSAIATLAAVLGSDLTAFFPNPGSSRVTVHRAGDPDRLRMAPSSTESYTILSGANGASFTALIHHVYPGTDHIRFRYFGERFALVLSGQIELTIGTSTHRLGPDDTIHYSSHPEHAMRVTSHTPAEVLWVVSPALLG